MAGDIKLSFVSFSLTSSSNGADALDPPLNENSSAVFSLKFKRLNIIANKERFVLLSIWQATIWIISVTEAGRRPSRTYATFKTRNREIQC